jgi:ATP-dependent RNA helicase DHX37/DHR1
MVRRLRKALAPRLKDRDSVGDFEDVSPGEGGDNQDAPRDMDDEEVDGDIFQSDEPDDYDNMDNADQGPEESDDQREGDGIPRHTTVLPLYSLLSADDQAKVFAPVPDGHRLIVVATNIAETSITIPGVSYVVDSGRQKCRNFNAKTGMSSFDIMWISKAAADQRAGRSGRCGPGHCYRLYSSSMYSRHMDAFALPEVLTRPLEDVVLAMKAMKISNVASFPFPTAPDRSQIDASVKLLANIGCVDISKIESEGGDGVATRLGFAVSKLPLGVRFGKMLLVAAQAGVLDYAIAMVAALSESNPFIYNGQLTEEDGEGDNESDDDRSKDEGPESSQLEVKNHRWKHKAGDVLAAMLAAGAYTYAGRGAGGASERAACRKFCKENGLNPVLMERIEKMRIHLARLARVRLGNADGIAAKTGGILSSMPPPTKVQELLLCQAIASGLLDNVAMLAPLGSIPGEHPFSLRSAYLSCSTNLKDPLFMDRNSVIYCRDFRSLPKWVCYESLMRKTLRDGTTVAVMKNITPVDPSWLGLLADRSNLLSVGEPLSLPLPVYDSEKDAVMCSAMTKFGNQGWEIPPIKVEMFDALQSPTAKQNVHFFPDDSFRWFGRFLLEGKVLPELKGLEDMLNDSPAAITRRMPISKVALFVSKLASEGIDSAGALRKHWAEVDNKFLFPQLKGWVKKDHQAEAKKLWIAAVKTHTKL